MVFVVFEGIDKSGKSYQCHSLFEHYKSRASSKLQLSKSLYQNETLMDPSATILSSSNTKDCLTDSQRHSPNEIHSFSKTVLLANETIEKAYPSFVHHLRYPMRSGTFTGPLINEYLAKRIDLHPNAASLLLAANLWEIFSSIPLSSESSNSVPAEIPSSQNFYAKSTLLLDKSLQQLNSCSNSEKTLTFHTNCNYISTNENQAQIPCPVSPLNLVESVNKKSVATLNNDSYCGGNYDDDDAKNASSTPNNSSSSKVSNINNIGHENINSNCHVSNRSTVKCPTSDVTDQTVENSTTSISKAIIDNLKSKDTLYLMDRYTWSNVAYSAGRGLPQWIAQSITDGLPMPDMIVWMDVKPSIAALRSEYGQERFDQVSFQQIVADSMASLAKSYETLSDNNCNDLKLLHIDGTKNPEVITTEIAAAIDSLFFTIESRNKF